MIDNDFNDQFAPPSLRDEKETPKWVTAVVFAVAFVIYAGVWALVYIPKIKNAVGETQFVEVVSNIDKYRESSSSREYTLFFVDINKNLVPIKTSVAVTGLSDYHNAVEGLLLGVDEKALASGVVSCIPAGTTLNGLSVSNGFAFVDLSHHFAEGESTWNDSYISTAQAQILATLNAINPKIVRVIILIDGMEISF